MKSADLYRVERQVQDARYENLTGLPVGETHRQEYRDYFGVGDCAAVNVERRVTFKEWLISQAAEPEPASLVSEEQAFYLSGADLAGLAAAGCWVAAGEIVRRVERRAARRGAA